MLSGYRDRGYAIATTEAGVVPFVADWRTLDTYGLNDTHIARHGLDQTYWDSFNPAVVLNHSARWLGRPLVSYHIYFLRRDLLEFDELATKIRSVEGESYARIPKSFVEYFSR